MLQQTPEQLAAAVAATGQTPVGYNAPASSSSVSSWNLSPWTSNSSGAFTQTPTLTINGTPFTSSNPQDYIAKLQQLQTQGATGPVAQFISQFQSAFPNSGSTTAPAATTPAATTPAATATPAATPQVNAPTVALQPGSTDSASVKQLQDYLVAHGYMTAAQEATGPGIYGPQTTAAVLALQKNLGIDYSSGPGDFGPITMAALANSHNATSPVTPTTPTTDTTTGVTTPTTPTTPTTSTTDVATLADEIRQLYGLAPANSSVSPVQQAVDDYNQIYTSLGIPTIKDSYDQAVKAFGDVTDEMNDKIADINEDPWLSEGERTGRITAIQNRYQTKLDTQTNLMNLYKSMVDQGTTQANSILGQIHNTQTSNEDAVNQAISIVQKQQDAASALAKDNVVVDDGTNQLLINKESGQTVAILGPSTKNPAMTLSDKEDLAAFTASLRTDNPANTTDITNYNYLKSQGYTKTFEQYLADKNNPLSALFGGDTSGSTPAPTTPLSLYDQVSNIDFSSLNL